MLPVGISFLTFQAMSYTIDLGPAADEVFMPGKTGLLSNWIGVLAFTFQICFDFSGYSDMAGGLGAMFGFQFPRNFDSPYRTLSISEFWQRWHITLSTWIRDCLYFSLGGNRTTPARIYRNLATSMLLCGLWHGASLTFVVWGALHGFFLKSVPAALSAAAMRSCSISHSRPEVSPTSPVAE